MADNLSAPSANTNDPRPHQQGRAEGYKAGTGVSATVEWLVDTGAQVSCVTKSVGDQFDLSATGASATGTTGGGGIIMNTGLDMVFEVFDSQGYKTSVTCGLPVGVKSDDQGGDILGMDQIEQVGAIVEWDPTVKQGRLRQP